MKEDGIPDAATETFVAHRDLLFTIVHEMLGSATGAEHVLQETWLRLAEVELATVRDERAYLVRVAIHQAITRLRTLGQRKGPDSSLWLPEPLMTTPDVTDELELELVSSLSMAMMSALETLSPTERAVFGLREVFDLGYEEIAAAIDKSPAAVRQIAHRTQAHVAARRPRDLVFPAENRAAFVAFQRAVESGDLQSLVGILAPDVVALSDRGGLKQAMPGPVVGASNVANLLALLPDRVGVDLSVEPVRINGSPGLVVRLNGELDMVVALRVVGGLVTGLYSVRNPERAVASTARKSVSR